VNKVMPKTYQIALLRLNTEFYDEEI
jgi:hypothetical protein